MLWKAAIPAPRKLPQIGLPDHLKARFKPTDRACGYHDLECPWLHREVHLTIVEAELLRGKREFDTTFLACTKDDSPKSLQFDGTIGFTVNLSITKSTGWAILGSCVMTTSLMFVSPGVAGRVTDNSDGLAAVTLRRVKSSFPMRAGLFEEFGFAGLKAMVAKSKGCLDR
jgi:hypothetical protein